MTVPLPALPERDSYSYIKSELSHSVNGRFFLIPQDYQGGIDRAALAKNAIGQDRMQDWVANRVKAKKAIIQIGRASCRERV
jgi:hypothetical protein